jgi:hypothetical protein
MSGIERVKVIGYKLCFTESLLTVIKFITQNYK